MTKKAAVIVLFLAVFFIGSLVWAILTRNELSKTQHELLSTSAQLALTITEMEETKNRLADTEDELTSTRIELASTENELASTKNELTITEKDLASTKNELATTESELTSTRDELSNTQKQLSVAQETLGGLGITLWTSEECSDVVLTDNHSATNPTWSQLMAFLSQDQTETHTYIRNVYDCSQFSRDIHNNAEAAGIRAAEVAVDFSNKVDGHALNAFLTTDYGLVYVDCTEAPDKIARVKAGTVFRAVKAYYITAINIRNDYWWDFLVSYYYIPASMGGEAVTSSIRIYW